MKHLLSTFVLMAYGLAHAVPYLHGVTDKDPLSYAVGEDIAFTVSLEGAESFPDGVAATWRRSGDDGVEEKGTWDGRALLTVKTKLKRAGFVRLTVEPRHEATGKSWRIEGANSDVFFDGGAGAGVNTLVQSKPEPKDFDAFWKACRDELDAVPVNADLEEIPSPTVGVRLYKVKVTCPGGTGFTTGYLSVPDGEKKVMAVASFFGYQFSWTKGAYMPPSSVPTTEIHFYVSAHGFELGREPTYYQSFREAVGSNGFGHGFDPAQNAKPETCYFHGMALRVMRAVEYLKTRPEWNGRDLVVAGGSQGSLQAMWCAAFVPGVTEAKIFIPWLCDVGGTTDGRNHGDWFPAWAPGLDYFDQVNVAKRVPETCRVEISRIGLGDYIAPPCGAAIMYHSLKCPKSAVWMQGSTHGYVPPNPQTISWKDLSGDRTWSCKVVEQICSEAAPGAGETVESAATGSNGVEAVVGNPISALIGRPVCDPHMIEWKGRLYMFAGHDFSLDSSWYDLRDWWVWSSADMLEWRLESVLKPEDTFLKRPFKSCWATFGVPFPDGWRCYFSVGPKEIGVVTAGTPAGPWCDPLGKPLVANGQYQTEARDPDVLIDDDGFAYIVFGTYNYFIAKLGADGYSLAEKARPLEIKGAFGPYGQDKTDDKPSLHKRGGLYYLSWSSFYAVSENVYGPYTYRGSVIDAAHISPKFRSDRSELHYDRHGNFFQFNGQWYYVANDYSQPGRTRYFRDAVMGYVHYRANGDIAPVRIDEVGVGQYDASRGEIEAEDYFDLRGEATVGECPFGGFELRMGNGSAVRYPNIRNVPANATISISLWSKSGCTLEFREGKPDGRVLGTANVRGRRPCHFVKSTVGLQNEPGALDLWIVAKVGDDEHCSIDWFSFRATKDPWAGVTASCKMAGGTFLLEHLDRKLGVSRAVEKCFGQLSPKIMSVVYYLAQKGQPLSRCETWSDGHLHPYGDVITSQDMSALLDLIGPDEQLKFFSLWLAKICESEYLCYDITSVSSYASNIPYVKYGYNRDRESLPQINVAMLYGQKSMMPAYFRRGRLFSTEWFRFVRSSASSRSLRWVREGPHT